MEYILIGKYVNTHGLRGEIRVISEAKNKQDIFATHTIVYIGKDKQKFIIDSYRQHKQYDMLTFVGVNNINDIEYLKGSYMYINRKDLEGKNILLVEELIGYKVFVDDKYIGDIIEILKNKANDILVVSNNRILIPYVNSFVKSIDKKKQLIEINDIEGLI